MYLAMPWPCIGSNRRVRRISMSSVPCNSPTRFMVVSLPIRGLAPNFRAIVCVVLASCRARNFAACPRIGPPSLRVDRHQMLAALQRNTEALARVQKRHRSICAIDLEACGLAVHQSEGPRGAFVRQIDAALAGALGGLESAVKIQDPRGGTFDARFDSMGAGRKPDRQAVSDGPGLAIHQRLTAPGHSDALRSIDLQP